MKLITFPEANIVLAKDQPQYEPLPACVFMDGTMLSCWHLTLWERVKLLWRGKLWLMQLTFHSPLQPQLPSVDKPVIEQRRDE